MSVQRIQAFFHIFGTDLRKSFLLSTQIKIFFKKVFFFFFLLYIDVRIIDVL